MSYGLLFRGFVIGARQTEEVLFCLFQTWLMYIGLIIDSRWSSVAAGIMFRADGATCCFRKWSLAFYQSVMFRRKDLCALIGAARLPSREPYRPQTQILNPTVFTFLLLLQARSFFSAHRYTVLKTQDVSGDFPQQRLGVV